MISKKFSEDESLNRIANELHCDVSTLQNILSSLSSHYYIRYDISTSGKKRTIYCPDQVLVELQKRINKYILSGILLPNSMHGYRKKRSTATNARCHEGKKFVAKFDIQDFFPSIHYTRIAKIFISLGFNLSESKILTHLVTADYCLPHGFVTSPRLASICLINVEKRIKSVIRGIPITVTFYSDDITFSGNFSLKSFKNIIVKVFKQEGFKIKTDKIKFLNPFTRHEITGIVANKRLNLRRSEREKIQAIIHNCLKLGPASQMQEYFAAYGIKSRDMLTLKKFKESLNGKISYIKPINPSLYKSLKSDFEKILW